MRVGTVRGRLAIRDPRSAFRVALAALLLTAAGGARATAWWDEEDNEEPAGASCMFQFNPQDEVYGVAVGGGAWIRDTPIFGDYFLTLFSNRIEDSVYSGLGMTIRIMPHWRVAPFVGGGASYNYSLSNHGTTNEEASSTIVVNGANVEVDARGDSYWAGHAEAGIRFWIPGRIQLLELMGRYTWSGSKTPDADYWLAGIAIGAGI